MNNDPQITLGDVLEAEPGDGQNKAWINGEFDALVSDIVPKTSRQNGRSFWTAIVSDPDNPNIRLETTFFVNPMRLQNCVCHFSGGGMSREEYQGQPKLGLGKNTLVQPVGQPQNPPPRQQTNQQRSTPARQQAASNTRPPANSRPPANQPAGQGGPRPLLGSMVGAAIGQAIGLLKESLPRDAAGAIARGDLFGTGFTHDLFTLASDIIRVNQRLEAGNLAKSPSQRNADPLTEDQDPGPGDPPEENPPQNQQPQGGRADVAPPSRSRANPAGPGGTAFPIDNSNLDEDVPF